ncbi:uncharacterized protein DNG_04200 [Cephalotrichum gorgonifer]|uniref:Uncharacterized protein n=1 Tax=Cephalotrichum gorgonifer TaxID=2041049 RepID=A0AAE8SUB0_9PEZI|nr:uncharacterized protein DNG_04200 [Cephalotrichum gorgonifer]
MDGDLTNKHLLPLRTITTALCYTIDLTIEYPRSDLNLKPGGNALRPAPGARYAS